MSFRVSLVHPQPVHRRSPGEPVTADHNSLATLTAQARALEGTAGRARWWAPAGAARHLYRRNRACRADHHLRAADRDPAGLLAPATSHLRGHARPAHRRPGAGQHRLGPGQPRRLWRQRGRPGHRYARTKEFMRLVRRLWTEENVTYAGEHSRSPTPPWRRRSRPAARPASQALLRRRFRGRRAVSRPRPTPALLGRAARGRRRTDRAAEAPERGTGPRPPAAGVRPADHHLSSRHHRAGLGRRRGEGGRDGQGPETAGRATHGDAVTASGGCSICTSAARCSTTTSTPRRASSAAAARTRPGWSARRRTSPLAAEVRRPSASPTSCCPTRPTWPRSSGRATSCCRCCGRRRPPRHPRRSLRLPGYRAPEALGFRRAGQHPGGRPQREAATRLRVAVV